MRRKKEKTGLDNTLKCGLIRLVALHKLRTGMSEAEEHQT